MRRWWAALLPLLVVAQGSGMLELGSIPQTMVKRGATVVVEVPAHLKSGYHVNSNAPLDEYLIPLKLSWEAGPLDVVETVYPQAKQEKYAFSEKPLAVYSGDFRIATKFKAKAEAAAGPVVVAGKLRYQACTDRECFPPKTVPVTVAVNVQ